MRRSILVSCTPLLFAASCAISEDAEDGKVGESPDEVAAEEAAPAPEAPAFGSNTFSNTDITMAALVNTTALAQPTFAPQVTYASPDGSGDVAAGDLDGDGDLDLVTALGAEGVGVLLGDGDGTFGAIADFSIGGSSFELALGDINNDGDLDVVSTVDSFTGKLGAALGNGDGTFAAPLTFTGGSVPNCIVLADFDEDGQLDVAMGNSNVDGVDLFIGNGDGTFDPAVNLDSGFSSTDVKVADVDEDGDLDLLSAVDFSDIHVLLGNGNGTFAAALVESAGASNTGMDIDLGDFDRDGNLDLVATQADDDRVGVLLGNGNGTFDAVTYFPAGDYPTGVIAADIDGDAMMDFAVTDQLSDQVRIRAGRGNGTFEAAVVIPVGDAPRGLVKADLDGDGDLDLAAANSSSLNIGVLINLRPPNRVGINAAACAFVNLADALAVAAFGDTIYASPGIYNEATLVLSADSHTIAGANAACTAFTSGQVTLQPTAGRMFDLDATTLTLRGLTVWGGSIAGNGGSIYADNVSTLILHDAHLNGGTSTVRGGCFYGVDSTISLVSASTIENCVTDGYGGGAYLDGGTLAMAAGTAIRNNQALTGAGGGAVLSGAIASIQGEVSGNSAAGGGGLEAMTDGAVPSQVELSGSARVTGNDSAGFGGGVSLTGSNSVLRVIDTAAVSGNTAVESGGGIYVVAAAVEIEEGAAVEDNKAGVNGGGIYVLQSTVDLAGISLSFGVDVERNEAVAHGGGIYLDDSSTLTSHFADFTGNSGGGGGGLWAEGASSADLRNTRFTINIAGEDDGGGIHVLGEGSSLVLKSDFNTCNPLPLSRSRYCSEVFFNRTTGNGGGILVQDHATAEISTTAFIANDSPTNGEAILVYTNIGAPTEAVIRNCLFAFHISDNAPAVTNTNSDVEILSSTFSENTFPVVYLPGGAVGLFHRNIVWGNTNDSMLNGIAGNCNTTQTALGAPVGAINDQLDPLFDAAHVRSPYKLLAASPAIDACTTGPANDLDGVTRPIPMGLWDRGTFEMP